MSEVVVDLLQLHTALKDKVPTVHFSFSSLEAFQATWNYHKPENWSRNYQQHLPGSGLLIRHALTAV